MEKILVLNSGSSSLKYQLFNVDGDNLKLLQKVWPTVSALKGRW